MNQTILIFTITVVVIMLLLMFIVRKKLKIKTEIGLYKYINKTHKWGERILLLLFFITLSIAYFGFYYVEVYLIFIFFLAQSIFRAFMEWKYEREEKEYIISLIGAGTSVVLFIGVLFFSLQTTTFEVFLEENKNLNLDSIPKIEIGNYAWNDEERSLHDKEILKREVHIEDQRIINRIFAELHALELREREIDKDSLGNYYSFFVDRNRYFEITIYDEYLSISTDDYHVYRVTNQNGLYRFLEEGDLNWVFPESEK
ncbi:DUF4181 domain-containing protein [Ornithinibacillus californiensis]|uniref:DUF4181 domain-containing protein n=1 Tax=Ornithinibacillus californiensis TaxID=161536 RepID=UPI00064D8267|nr:DUF4181 domain-containing protein [Ornithinibacillus californiensis]